MQGVIVSAEHLKEALTSDTPPRLFDTRFDLRDTAWGMRAYSDAHIPGAIYAHLDEVLSSPVIRGKTGRHPLPDPDSFVKFLEHCGIRNEDEVVIYDQGLGGIAARMWWLFKWIGHQEVSVLDGGWEAWQSLGGDTESAIQAFSASNYAISLRNDLVVERSELLETEEGQTVVDSRDARRYYGLEEPIDPVAGHIPGAINMPFRQNIADNGGWKSRPELRERFDDLRGEIIFYCGSGVTACHNILAYEHAGLGEAKLYPGSWSEWITDPDAPIVTADQ